ncbi:MAG: RsmD family RNA methyltransferase [Gemmatimonadota bacterium]|nr:RsmD family RNA methyltransferase [Gemmatimonadota bacterium]
MRIVTGKLKGRSIPFDVGKHGNARVTPARIKEAAFNMLGARLDHLQFLDLFSCSGQIGLEAYSRGARVLLNEPDRRRHGFISRLLKEWGAEKQVRLTNHRAERLLPLLESEQRTFDVIYADPPYRLQRNGVPYALAVLSRLSGSVLVPPSAHVLIQHAADLDAPVTVRRLSLCVRKTYGGTALSIYRKACGDR